MDRRKIKNIILTAIDTYIIIRQVQRVIRAIDDLDTTLYRLRKRL